MYCLPKLVIIIPSQKLKSHYLSFQYLTHYDYQKSEYMNGATPELPAKTNNKLSNTKMTIIGINHQSFLCQRKTSNSPSIPNLDKKLLNEPTSASPSIR